MQPMIINSNGLLARGPLEKKLPEILEQLIFYFLSPDRAYESITIIETAKTAQKLSLFIAKKN